MEERRCPHCGIFIRIYRVQGDGSARLRPQRYIRHPHRRNDRPAGELCEGSRELVNEGRTHDPEGA